MELVQSNTKFSTKNYGLGLIIVSAIIFIGFNQSVPMNTDVSWLVHVGESWLNNGKYITDYYETNPPLAFYVYLPVHYIIDIFNIRLNLAFTLYYAFIASLSLLLINRCLQAFKSSFAVRLTSLLVLIVCFYWMPLFQLGQRDPLSSVLVIPHVLLVFLVYSGKCQLGIKSRSLILMLAMIGYMLKPQFIIIWLTLFVTLLYQTRSIRLSLRLSQAFKFFWGGVIYILIVYLFNHEYFTKALPLIWKSYYPVMQGNRFTLMRIDPLFVFRTWIIAILSYSLYLVISKEKSPLYLAYACLATAYTLCYFVQGIGFTYQAIPGLTCSILLICSVSIGMLPKQKKFILFLFLGILMSLLSFRNSMISKEFFHMNINKLAKAIKTLPPNATVGVLICGNFSAFPVTFHSDIQYKSSLPTIFQPCLAYKRLKLGKDNKIKEAFQILANIMRNDLMRNKPEYLITVDNKTRKNIAELKFLDEVYSQGISKDFWRQYQVKSTVNDYAIRQRK